MSSFDVAVLGGGIIGCAVAETLAEAGQRVVLIERRHLGAEASTAAAGILSTQLDIQHPGPLFELCHAARQLYPRWVKHLEQRAGISVDYHVDGILYLVQTRRESQELERQARWQRHQGLRVERWSPADVHQKEPALDGRLRGGFYFPMGAQVDTLALMRALATTTRTAGVEIHEETSVRTLRIRRGAVQGVTTNRGVLMAPVVINCLGSWANMGGRFPVELPVEPARGQMLAFRGPTRLLRHIVMSRRAYAVQRRDGRLLMGSTIERAGFAKTLTIAGIHGILSGVQRMSRAFGACTLLDAWAGFRPLTTDGLPIIGATKIAGLYAATGHYRHGILLAPITATALRDVVLHGSSPVDLAPFSPQRFTS